jgi:hypothetical protein
MHLANQAGFLPQVIFESGDMSIMIRALVSQGMGIAAFPQSVIDAARRSLVPLDLSPALPSRTIQLAWHRQRASTPTIQTFLDFVQEDLALHPWTGVHSVRWSMLIDVMTTYMILLRGMRLIGKNKAPICLSQADTGRHTEQSFFEKAVHCFRHHEKFQSPEKESQEKCSAVGMESTGVYWMPVYRGSGIISPIDSASH